MGDPKDTLEVLLSQLRDPLGVYARPPPMEQIRLERSSEECPPEWRHRLLSQLRDPLGVYARPPPMEQIRLERSSEECPPEWRHRATMPLTLTGWAVARFTTLDDVAKQANEPIQFRCQNEVLMWGSIGCHELVGDAMGARLRMRFPMPIRVRAGEVIALRFGNANPDSVCLWAVAWRE